MALFDDPRLEQIRSTRTCASLPQAVWYPAYRTTRLLIASRTWGDVRAFTRVARLEDGRYAAPVHGRWGLTFEWTDGLGARALALERL